MSEVSESINVPTDGSLQGTVTAAQGFLKERLLVDPHQKNRAYSLGVSDSGAILLVLENDYLFLNRERVGDLLTNILEGLRDAKAPGVIVEITKVSHEDNLNKEGIPSGKTSQSPILDEIQKSPSPPAAYDLGKRG